MKKFSSCVFMRTTITYKYKNICGCIIDAPETSLSQQTEANCGKYCSMYYLHVCQFSIVILEIPAPYFSVFNNEHIALIDA